jgi:hypothetical protein
MKRTADGGWAHVVCALYIPEVSFADDTTMEPIILSKIPTTRFGQECTICVQNGRPKAISGSGACCNCTVKNCSQVFHVTCAQANGLLCEDIRKNNCQYPIYCEQHRPKLSVSQERRTLRVRRFVCLEIYTANTFVFLLTELSCIDRTTGSAGRSSINGLISQSLIRCFYPLTGCIIQR